MRDRPVRCREVLPGAPSRHHRRGHGRPVGRSSARATRHQQYCGA